MPRCQITTEVILGDGAALVHDRLLSETNKECHFHLGKRHGLLVSSGSAFVPEGLGVWPRQVPRNSSIGSMVDYAKDVAGVFQRQRIASVH